MEAIDFKDLQGMRYELSTVRRMAYKMHTRFHLPAFTFITDIFFVQINGELLFFLTSTPLSLGEPLTSRV